MLFATLLVTFLYGQVLSIPLQLSKARSHEVLTRLDVYESCCPDEGEECPPEDVNCDSIHILLEKDYTRCCRLEGEDCPDDHINSCRRMKLLFPTVLLDESRIKEYEQCCPDEGEDCPAEDVNCDAILNVLQKEHVQCCEEEGEDCPEDTVNTCRRVKLLLPGVLLDENRITEYEQCCPDEGEDCPAEDVNCDAILNLLQKEHAQCCEAEGEDCPEDTVNTCRRVKLLLPSVLLDENRITEYEQCCPDDGEECPGDISCDAILNVLQKEHAQCCEAEGEDCPEDSVNTCRRVKLLLPSVLLDENRITEYEQCCPDEGEDCPAEDINCDSVLNFLQKDHTRCCEAEGEDCPEDSVNTCRRLKLVLPTVDV